RRPRACRDRSARRRAVRQAYIEAMIKGHTEVQNMIDSQLKEANNEAVKKHLMETRDHVAMHFDQARKLQAAMNR
ncbi:MAG TPA: DUF4142 domain-containing protein, partial [Nitrospiraceae bacterium]|nr:DUF4142 domain-containing protein [Nitrospiraceae bacterium]